MFKKQLEVADFAERHELGGTTPFRILDLVAEVGEISADAAKSSDYGLKENELAVKKDEIGDVLFSLLLLSESLDIDAEEALEESMNKYSERIASKGDAGSN